LSEKSIYSCFNIDADELCIIDNLEPAPKLKLKRRCRARLEQDVDSSNKRVCHGEESSVVDEGPPYSGMRIGQSDPSVQPTTSTNTMAGISAQHPRSQIQFPSMDSMRWENHLPPIITVSPQDLSNVSFGSNYSMSDTEPQHSQIMMTGGLQSAFQQHNPMLSLPMVPNPLLYASQPAASMGHMAQTQGPRWFDSSPASAGQVSYGM
jgi:hypothetical protein